MNTNLNNRNNNHLVYLGLIPLIATLYTSYLSSSQGKAAELLWVCNISNIVLAVGLFTRNSMLIRIATLWLIIGTPLWIWDNLLHDYDFIAHAYVIHIGGLAIGLYASRFVSHEVSAWKPALMFGLVLTLISRFVTPPELNINISAYVYEPLKSFLPHYYYYMLFNAVCYSFGLIILEKLLFRFSQIGINTKQV